MAVKIRYLIPAAALLAVVACTGSSRSTPLAPSPAPALPGPGVTLSGRILEVLPDGTRHAISARQVDIEVDVDNPTDPKRGGWVPVGTDGSYRLSGVPDNRFVKIGGVDTTGLDRTVSYRLCASNTITRGDTTLDVSLFLLGAAVPTPTLSGRVFTVIQGEPIPLAGADVYYRSRGYGPDVVGYTDRDGHYSLCGLPSMPGTLYMICGNDVTAYSQAVDIRADTVLDIDATTFHTCVVPATAGAASARSARSKN